jgi:hypothetical protein
MGKQALFALAGLLGLSASVSAQDIRDFVSVQPVKERTDCFGTLTNVWNDPVPLQLADRRVFTFPSAFAWMPAPPAYYIPAMPLAAPPQVVANTTIVPDSPDRSPGLLSKVDYAGGEVGFFYGKSSGKFGREVTAGYILGEVVEGNTHISVGASYDHTTGRAPRLISR